MISGSRSGGIEAFQKRINDRLVDMQRQIAVEGYRMLSAKAVSVSGAYGSPVFTGRYRGSIRVGIGSPDTSTAPPPTKAQRDAAEKGNPTIRALNAADVKIQLQDLEPFQKVYLSNSVPYVRVIEFGAHSLQVPDGVFRVTGAALATWAKARNFNANQILVE